MGVHQQGVRRVKVAVGVVAHEDRFERAERLCHTVGAVTCGLDDGALGCAGNHMLVLSKLVGFDDADWCLVLEDDAVVDPATFVAQVKAALGCAPAPIVGLYLGTGNPSGQPQRQIRQAVADATPHKAWITADCLIGSVGYAIRTSLIEAMLREIADADGEFPLRVSRWAQQWDFDICYTMPSLVDHADDDPIGHPASQPRAQRRAWAYGTRENWDTGAVPLGHCNDWSKP